jgi:trigger factor
LKVETQPQENRTLKLTVEVDDERLQPALRAAARRISKDYRIPGFRPGKAPYEVVVRHFGENTLYQSAIEDLSQSIYKEVLEQENIDPYAPGALEDIQFKPVVLTYTVPLAPEIDLGDYRALRVPFEAPTVSDQAVQEQLEHLREHQAVVEPVERPAQLTDVVTLDAKGYLNTGENPSDFLLADQDVALVLDENADWPMPGFAQQVLGLSAGEERKFDLAFADDYANESLRGQVAHFEVAVKEVKGRTLPEWNDELARALGDHESLEALRAATRAELERQAAGQVERAYADQVIEQLVGQATVSYPPVLLENELDGVLDDLDRRLREQRLTLDDYLKIQKKTKEQMREESRPAAERRLKRSLVLGKIVALEGLTVSADEVEERVEALSVPWGDRSGEMRKVLQSEDSRRMLAVDILTDKAVERLIAIAKGEAVPPPAPQGQAEIDLRPTLIEPAAEAPAEAATETDQNPDGAAEAAASTAPAEAEASPQQQ